MRATCRPSRRWTSPGERPAELEARRWGAKFAAPHPRRYLPHIEALRAEVATALDAVLRQKWAHDAMAAKAEDELRTCRAALAAARGELAESRDRESRLAIALAVAEDRARAAEAAGEWTVRRGGIALVAHASPG